MSKSHNPLLYPLCFLIAGIIAGSCHGLSAVYYISAFCVVSLLFLIVKSQDKKSAIIYILFFILGYIFLNVNDLSSSASHFSKQISIHANFTVSKKEKTTKGFRYFGSVQSVRIDGNDVQTVGKLMVYTPESFELQRHHTYKIHPDFKEISKFKNPGRFDYGTFLANQNIYHSCYLESIPDLIAEGNQFLSFLEQLSSNGKTFFLDKFANHENAAFVNALLLGDKKGMAKENRELFINNGLAHLLAISGMHVGIILIILNAIFSFISEPKYRGILVISGIWLYILLSGLQIPAIRAGFMFTVYLVGQFSNRNIKGLNSVFFAALVLLSINPMLVYQLSFQLSFTAMISILLFYKKILEIFKFESVIATKIWQLFALNISVQVFILPLSVFYFHQFPTYSIVTSMLSIPFIVAIMWGGMLAVTCSFNSLIADSVCYLLEALIEIYIFLLRATSSLPYSLIENIELHSSQLIFWFFGAIGFYYYIQRKHFNVNFACMSFIPLILASSMLNLASLQTKKIVIYDDPKQIIIDFESNNEIRRFKEDLYRFSYQVDNRKDSSIIISELPTRMDIAGVKLSIVNSPADYQSLPFCNICILNSKNEMPLIEEKCALIIIPRRLNSINKFKNQYSIHENGAFTYKF